MSKIYLSPPSTTPADRAALLEAFDSNWLAPIGPALAGFESDFVALTGREAAVGVSSGTAGLHLSLIVAGIGPGDRVAVSTLTFAATVNAIIYVGAEPILIDSEASTWNMCPEQLERAVVWAESTGNPIKAVIPVDLYGQCCDYDALLPLCSAHNIVVIEDSAEALGGSYGGRPAGSFGEFSVFSFNGNKIVTTSGGGMVVGATEQIERIRHLATQAREPHAHYEHNEVGYNYRLSNLLAALGRSQLSTLGDRVRRRAEIRAAYEEGLAGIEEVGFAPIGPKAVSNNWLSCITVDPSIGVRPDEVCLELAEHDIEARPLWKPMHEQPVFGETKAFLNGVSSKLFAVGLCLPSGSGLTVDEQDFVIRNVKKALGRS
jgi:pyridoxal phosphate-dependent aminotransferase EpsN